MTLDKSTAEYRFLATTAINAALMALDRRELRDDLAWRIRALLYAARDEAGRGEWTDARENAMRAADLAPSDSDVRGAAYAAAQVLGARTLDEARQSFRAAIAMVLSP